MNGARKYKGLIAGLIVGTIVGFGIALFALPTGPPRWIVFPDRQIHDYSDFGGPAIVQGRINDRPAYPNNLVYISCHKSSQSCEMLKVEEIDTPDKARYSWPQVGYIDAPEQFTLTHWDKNSLTAIDDDNCEKRQLNIDFSGSEAEIVVQPQNLTDMHCKGTNPTVVRYPIEDKLDLFNEKHAAR